MLLFWHTTCFSIWSSSQIQSSHLKWPQNPVHGTTELETRRCLANRTSFQKLHCKLIELLVVTWNVACSSRDSYSALKTLVCLARATEAGSPVLNPSWAQSGSSLFSCSSWNRDQGRASCRTSHCLPTESKHMALAVTPSLRGPTLM